MRLSPRSQLALVVAVSLPLAFLFLQIEPGTNREPRWPVLEKFYLPGFIVGLMLLGGPHGAPRWGIEAGAFLGVIGQNLAIWYASLFLRNLWTRMQRAT